MRETIRLPMNREPDMGSISVMGAVFFPQNHNLLWLENVQPQRTKKTLKNLEKVVDKAGNAWYFIKVPADGGT